MRPSRAMIPMELLAASISILVGLVGMTGWPPGIGTLYAALHSYGERYLWFVLLASPAVAMLGFGWLEWFSKELRMSPERVDRNARRRARASLLQLVSWIYGLKLLADANGAGWIGLLAVIMVVFLGWSYVENRRVQREIRNATTRYLAPGR